MDQATRASSARRMCRASSFLFYHTCTPKKKDSSDLSSRRRASPRHLRLDLLQRLPFRLRDGQINRSQRDHAHDAEDVVRPRLTVRRDHRGKVQRHEVVGREVRQRRGAHRGGSHALRENLPHEQPRDRTERHLISADVREDREDGQTRGVQTVRGVAGRERVRARAQRDGRERHRRDAAEEQRPPSDAVDVLHREPCHDELEDAQDDAHARALGRVEPRGDEHLLGVVQHARLPGDLLEQDDGEADEQRPNVLLPQELADAADAGLFRGGGHRAHLRVDRPGRRLISSQDLQRRARVVRVAASLQRPPRRIRQL
mmetsp:Transcript_961/g.3207  ORF Transcript_961/g.3207 Transcript_961/m.3207 type:complete len:315 (+) Transcript_961:12-956(+)